MATLPVYAIMPVTLAITGFQLVNYADKLVLNCTFSEQLSRFWLRFYQYCQYLVDCLNKKETPESVCVSCDEYTCIVYLFTYFN